MHFAAQCLTVRRVAQFTRYYLTRLIGELQSMEADLSTFNDNTNCKAAMENVRKAAIHLESALAILLRLKTHNKRTREKDIEEDLFGR